MEHYGTNKIFCTFVKDYSQQFNIDFDGLKIIDIEYIGKGIFDK